MLELAVVIATILVGLTLLIPVIGITVHSVLRPFVAALTSRREAVAQQELLEQRVALLEERLHQLEQSSTPLLRDDIIDR